MKNKLKSLSPSLMSDAVPASAVAYHLEKDLPYYEGNMPRSGDLTYLQERCKLDIYYPKQGNNHPVIIYFHGGGLTAGSKFIPAGLMNSGLIVIAPNYRLSSDRASCPDYLNDAGAAVVWTLRNIQSYGGDPRLVFVSGTSAGGYLSAMIGLDPRWLKQFGHSNTDLAGVMPITGQMSTHFQILNERRNRKIIADSVHTMVDNFAPIFHTAGPKPYMSFYVGDRQLDWPARTEENAWLAAILKRVENKRRVSFHELSGFNHDSVTDPSFLLIREEIAGMIKARRKNVLPRPGHRIISSRPVRLTFGSRSGGKSPHQTDALMQINKDCLLVTVSCLEPQMQETVKKKVIYESDSVELFLEFEKGSVGQWVLAADGRSQFFGHNMEEPKAECSVSRLSDRWEARFRIPLKIFPQVITRGNFIRNRLAGGKYEQSCLCPIAGKDNLSPDSFLTFVLLPEL